MIAARTHDRRSGGDDARSCGPSDDRADSTPARACCRPLFPRLLRLRSARFGLRDDQMIMERLHDAFGDSRIEDMQIPLHLTATDFANGNQAVFSQRAARSTRSARASPYRSCSARGRSTASCTSTATCRIRCRSAWRSGRRPGDRRHGLREPLPGAHLEGGALRVPGERDPVEQPAEVAVRVPRACAPRRDHLDHSAVQRSASGCSTPRRFPYIIEEGENAAREQLPYLLACSTRSPRAPEDQLVAKAADAPTGSKKNDITASRRARASASPSAISARVNGASNSR